ncbi:MAG TPA: PAS domain S-box protein [Azospirillum sp.]|nr:PAS domain S-box protein [Azospirillum sp.]
MQLDALRLSTDDIVRTFIDQPPAAYYIVQDDRFVFVNQALLAFLGRTEDELIGSNPLDLVAVAAG